MTSDIRSFFGGKKSSPNQDVKVDNSEVPVKKRSKNRKVVDDSEDDQTIPSRRESPKYEEVTTSDYFTSTSELKTATVKLSPTRPNKSPDPKPERPSRVRKMPSTSCSELIEDEKLLSPDESVNSHVISATTVKSEGKKGKNTKTHINHDKDSTPRKLNNRGRDNHSQKDSLKNVDLKDTTIVNSPVNSSESKKISTSRASLKSRKDNSIQKGKNMVDNEEIEPAVNSAFSKPSKPLEKSKSLKSKENDSSTVQAILDSISTVRAPTPPQDNDSKWDWRTAQAGANSGPPPAAGMKEIPEGQENCLSGLTFVFTGLLDTLARDEAQELVKRYGGKVTSGPSRKTSFVVLGNDAGPSKLRKIKDLSLKTINEDGLFELIRLMPADGGDSKEAEKNVAKKDLELEKIKKIAEEMEREEKRRINEIELAAKTQSTATASARKLVAPSSQLWTTKYAPTSVNQICGNKTVVEKLQSWLKGWPVSHKYNFQRKGPDGLGGYRALIIYGPPGIGKTTAAHLVAKLSGYDIIETNASDTRSKKLVESGLGEVLNNNSLLGYFAGQGKHINVKKKKIVLIIDEVDGMSAGDRGGVGALAQVCRKTDIPMILICNDRKLPKMKPFDFVTYDLPFRKPTVEQIRSRIATICHREGLKIAPNVLDALIEGSNKDIRQIINMVSSIKLDQTSIDYDQGKAMTKAWEKHIVLKPWDICHKFLSSGLFLPSSKATLNDKIELYFNDHEFSYLMIQENYLSTKPTITGDRSTKEAKLKVLQLSDEAAQSISDGDLVDKMIHGSQQQWSLLPTHAVFSTVRPASFVAGMMTGQTTFTRWLGNNSKQQKLSRYVKEIQSHIRLRTSVDRHEIRQHYIPFLWAETVKRMEKEGKECVEEVIELMDSYFLTRDDFDYILELGVGPHDMEKLSIESQTKATFTRLYNSRSHPLPFMKSSVVVAAPTDSRKEVPDLEEAFEQEDEKELVVTERNLDDDEVDIKKDKYIKQPKKKTASAQKNSKKRSKPLDEDAGSGGGNGDISKPQKRRKKGKPTSKM